VLPLLDYFDFVIALGAKGEHFGLLVIDQKEVVGVQMNPEQAEDLLRRLADLLFQRKRPDGAARTKGR